MSEMIESGRWIQLLLYVGASVAVAVYAYQTLLPRIRRLLGGTKDAEERTAELLDEYLRLGNMLQNVGSNDKIEHLVLEGHFLGVAKDRSAPIDHHVLSATVLRSRQPVQ